MGCECRPLEIEGGHGAAAVFSPHVDPSRCVLVPVLVSCQEPCGCSQRAQARVWGEMWG